MWYFCLPNRISIAYRAEGMGATVLELNYFSELAKGVTRTIFLFLENGQTYVQKKPTMYPPWDSTFDAHINKGRVMQIIVKGKNVDLISETTVELYSLAERCRKNNGKTEIWVSILAVSLHTVYVPSRDEYHISRRLPQTFSVILKLWYTNLESTDSLPLTHSWLDNDNDYSLWTIECIDILKCLWFLCKVKLS